MESTVAQETWDEPAIRPDAVLDVPVQAMIEMERGRLPLARLLTLHTGVVLPFDRPVEQPMDLLINGVRFARGKVVMVNGEFGFRLTEIGGRIKSRSALQTRGQRSP